MVTDVQLIDEIASHLQEDVNGGVSWSSGQWTPVEVLGYMNNRQNQFLKDSLCLLKRSDLATTPNVIRQPLPTDWVATQRITWTDGAGATTEIPRGDGWEADHGILDWSYNQGERPKLYTDGEVPTLELQVMPAPIQSGTLGALYAYNAPTLTGAGVALIVPDEFAPAIKWGTMADMLNKVGRAHDPARAGYCSARFDEGVEAAKIMLDGWL